MIFLWLATALLAAVPHLHHLLHEDAQNSEHQCVVSRIEEQSVLAEAPAVSPPLPCGPVFQPRLLVEPQFTSTLACLNFQGRAPPIAVLSAVALA